LQEGPSQSLLRFGPDLLCSGSELLRSGRRPELLCSGRCSDLLRSGCLCSGCRPDLLCSGCLRSGCLHAAGRSELLRSGWCCRRPGAGRRSRSGSGSAG